MAVKLPDIILGKATLDKYYLLMFWSCYILQWVAVYGEESKEMKVSQVTHKSVGRYHSFIK